MRIQIERILSLGVALLDALLIAGAAYLAVHVRFTYGPLYPGGEQHIEDNFLFYPLIVLIWTLCINSFAFLRWYLQKPFWKEMLAIVKGSLWALILFLAISYSTSELSYSRLMIFMVFSFSIIFVSIFRSIVRGVIVHSPFEISRRSRAIVIGPNETSIEEMDRLLKGHRYFQVGLVGKFILDKDGQNKNELLNKLPLFIRKNQITEVFLIISSDTVSRLIDILNMCNLFGVKFRFIFEDHTLQRAKNLNLYADNLGTVNAFTVSNMPEKVFSLILKRLIDIVGSLVLIIFAFPLMVFAALSLKISSPQHPVLFIQNRSGKYGVPFRMCKFRTMIPNAEQLRNKLVEQNELDGPAFKMKKDPRITKLGYFLRKTSIDELPQLFNVLRGDMSLVGPRPLPIIETDQSLDWQLRRLSMKPGLSCYWQISGRNNLSFDDWMKLDLKYIDNWTVKEDIKILFKTIKAVLSTKGAY